MDVLDGWDLFPNFYKFDFLTIFTHGQIQKNWILKNLRYSNIQVYLPMAEYGNVDFKNARFPNSLVFNVPL